MQMNSAATALSLCDGMKKKIYSLLQTSSVMLTGVPVNDADHAVLAVVGAVDAQLVQQVQQQHAEVAVKLADGGFEAGVGLEGVCVIG